MIFNKETLWNTIFLNILINMVWLFVSFKLYQTSFEDLICIINLSNGHFHILVNNMNEVCGRLLMKGHFKYF